MTPAELSWLYLEQRRRGTAKPSAAKQAQKPTLAQLLKANLSKKQSK